ncbi:hypothetical protein OG500_27105 [Kitasatospora sp. NBC_01250]|uniref:hypothetical protein n=1 Tax=Kitasatospora sp. NBC_01250 TaxID=2903571 RepID=UPI002E3000CE|nr:hypothetical protein [Kitasatospora sp. NBC_01250]
MKRALKKIGAVATATAAVLMTGAPSASATVGPGVKIPLTTATPNSRCGAEWIAYQTYLKFQCDGNLVLYRTSDNHAMWASGTYYGYIPNLLDFAHQGYISLWSGSDEVAEIGNISNPAPNGVVAVQDDGNMVIYNTAGQPVWQTGTYNNQQGSVHGQGA